MKRILLVSAVLILSLSCCRSEEYDVDLSTPEKTLRAYYDAFKRSDFKHQKRTIKKLSGQACDIEEEMGTFV